MRQNNLISETLRVLHKRMMPTVYHTSNKRLTPIQSEVAQEQRPIGPKNFSVINMSAGQPNEEYGFGYLREKFQRDSST